MLPPMTFEEAEKVVDRSLESIKAGNPYHSKEWNDGFKTAFQWTQRRLADFKELYALKKTDTKLEPVKPISFKVGQTLRRTSDGLKCLIHKDRFGCVCLVQMNNGHQFSWKTALGPSNDVTPQILEKITGGYSFVTEKQGRELGLYWAKEEAKRETTNCHSCHQPTADHVNGLCPLKGGLTNREFGGGTYSQH